jgi:RNA polymerase sigma-70 factor (ECF subfamily)
MPFQTTNWTLIVQAAGDDSASARSALAGLCEAYRSPVFAFIRRQGYSREDAEDLAQGYFTRFIEKGYVKGLSREAGRFRSFVLASVRHYLSNERDRERAEKRGGGRALLSLDAARADEHHALEPADHRTPEDVFERAWARCLTDQALNRLAEDMARTGAADRFTQLKAHLTEDDRTTNYRELAEAWGVKEASVRVYMHRMRQRWVQVVRNEVAATVAEPTDVDDELRYLLEILGRKD